VSGARCRVRMAATSSQESQVAMWSRCARPNRGSPARGIRKKVTVPASAHKRVGVAKPRQRGSRRNRQANTYIAATIVRKTVMPAAMWMLLSGVAGVPLALVWKTPEANADRMAVLRRMASWPAPGGWLMAEEADFGMWLADYDPIWAAHPAADPAAGPGRHRR
jgi:hypothetical protein